MAALERSGWINDSHTLTLLLLSLISVGASPGLQDRIADETGLDVDANYHGPDLVGIWLTAAGVSP